MSTEELLKQRVKVIAPYPNSPYMVGEILTEFFFDNGNSYFSVNDNEKTYPDRVISSGTINECPNIFRKMNWWEERELKDMPEYLKQTGMVDGADNPIPDWYLKVKKHFNAGNGEWRDDSINIFCIDKCDRTIGTNMSYSGFEPTTREEYEQHQLSKTK